MKIEINVTESFKKAARPLIRKYRSFLDDLLEMELELLKKPETGKSLGNSVYKIRLAIKSKNKGKSGGARVISYLERIESKDKHGLKEITVNLLTVYDKADQETIKDAELKELIQNIKK